MQKLIYANTLITIILAAFCIKIFFYIYEHGNSQNQVIEIKTFDMENALITGVLRRNNN
jgi:hypothetical protein